MRRPSSLLLLAVLAASSGCRNAAYLKAKELDTVEGYRRFLDSRPEAELVEAARSRLAELELQAARQQHTVVAYKRFIEEFPDSGEAITARTLLEGLRFNAAMAKGTSAALRQFLADHPQGAHRQEAQEKLEAVEKEALRTSTDPASLTAFLARFPEDADTPAAQQRLDDAVFGTIRTAAGLYRYLAEQPAGRHRDEAKQRLLTLEVRSLVLSGALDEAEAALKRSALPPSDAAVVRELSRARERRKAAAGSHALIQRAQAGYGLRPVEEVLLALKAPDPMDRWQAAEELGQHIDVRMLEPLLDAIRGARSPKVRFEAFFSLQRILKLLPFEVAEYQVARRLEALKDQAVDGALLLTRAVLLDLSGQLELGAAEYRRAWDERLPDPLVLRRWTSIRLERGQRFAAAVTARQLAVWAQQTAEALEAPTPVNALMTARELCAIHEGARLAVEALGQVGQASEFPEDVALFQRTARQAEALARARLRDAELVLLESRKDVRLCGDDAVGERLRAALRQRLEAVEALKKARVAGGELVLEQVRLTDPSPEVRARAGAT